MMKKIDPQFTVIDDLITSDEWNHVRYLIGEELKGLEVTDEVKREELPFFAYFEGTIRDKLIEAGFKKGIIENKKRLETTVKNLDQQGMGNAWCREARKGSVEDERLLHSQRTGQGIPGQPEDDLPALVGKGDTGLQGGALLEDCPEGY